MSDVLTKPPARARRTAAAPAAKARPKPAPRAPTPDEARVLLRPAGRPLRAAPSPIQRDQSAEEALHSLLADCAQMIERNALVLLLDDAPEGPHQFRVGLRRLRSALKAFRPAVSRATTRPVEAWAKELATAAGQWRDADVAVLDIYSPAAEADALGPGAAQLKRALDSERRRARAAAREEIRALNPAGLLDQVSDITAAHAWRGPVDGDKSARKRAMDRARAIAQPARKQARRALTVAWNKTAAWGDRLDALSIEERHEMRKALKTLRYTADFFAPLFDAEATAAFATQMRRLQNVFGYLNDVAMAESIGDRLEGGDRRADAARAMLAWHQTRSDAAWEKAQRRWRALEQTDRFW